MKVEMQEDCGLIYWKLKGGGAAESHQKEE